MLKPIDFSGIELTKWVRVYYKFLNPIVLLGFTPLGTLMSIRPTDTLLFGKSIVYRRLPIQGKYLDKTIQKLKPIVSEKKLIQSYSDLVNVDFSIEGLEHSFANKYGIRLMAKAYEDCTNDSSLKIASHLSDENKLLIAKANFIYRNSFEESEYDKSKITNENMTGSMDVFRKLMSSNDNKIFHIDDEGQSEHWYAFIKKIGNLNENNFQSISNKDIVKEGKDTLPLSV